MQILKSSYGIVNKDNQMIRMQNGTIIFNTINGARQAINGWLRNLNRYSSNKYNLENGYVMGYEEIGYDYIIGGEVMHFDRIVDITNYLLEHVYKIVKIKKATVDYE